jgi:hypothetical protein
VTDREFFRHALATLAYRTAKALRDAPEAFASFEAGPSTRTPLEIVAHMGDLMDWARGMAQGQRKWNASTPQAWDAERARLFASIEAFDQVVAGSEPLAFDLARLFQGPVADAFTHTGQLAMLRRLHGAPMKSESYVRSDIAIGRVGSEQASPDPKYEFD